MPAAKAIGAVNTVAPFTGAWIEIKSGMNMLKDRDNVAPFTGAWIEIPDAWEKFTIAPSRTLHGCVD